MRDTLKKWLTYAKLTKGWEIDPFTSHAQIYVIKNVVISSLHKISDL